MTTAVRLELLDRLGAKDLSPRERFDCRRADFFGSNKGQPREKDGKFAEKGAGSKIGFGKGNDLTDEELDAAEEEMWAQEQALSKAEDDEKKKRKDIASDLVIQNLNLDFDESKHSRAKDGKFGKKGTGQKLSSSVEASSDNTKAGDMKPVHDLNGAVIGTRKIMSDDEIAVIAKGKAMTKGGAIEAHPDISDDEYHAIEDHYTRKYEKKTNTDDDDENYLNAYTYKSMREISEEEDEEPKKSKRGWFGRRKDELIAELRADFDEAKHTQKKKRRADFFGSNKGQPREKDGKFAEKGAGSKIGFGKGNDLTDEELDAAEEEMWAQEQALSKAEDDEKKKRRADFFGSNKGQPREKDGKFAEKGAGSKIGFGKGNDLTDEELDAAEEEMWAQEQALSKAEDDEKKKRKDIASDLVIQNLNLDFDKSKHPRAKDGKFGKKGAGGGAAPKSGGRVNSPKFASPKNQKAAVKILNSVANDPDFVVYKDMFGRKQTRRKTTKKDIKIALGAVGVYMGLCAVSVALDSHYYAGKAREYDEAYKSREEAYRGYGGAGGGGAKGKQPPTNEEKASWHEALGVDKDADWQTVRKAYKTQAKKYHPDLNKDPKAEDMMKKVNTAFDSMDKLYESEKRKDIASALIVQRLNRDFKDELHPRDETGRFAKKKGGASAKGMVLAGLRSQKRPSKATGGIKNKKLNKALVVAGVSSIAVAGVMGAAALHIAHDLDKSSIPFDSIRQPPGGIPDEQTMATYDAMKPGDLIRKSFRSELGTRQHYGVYSGKDPKTGEHTVIDVGADWSDRDKVPVIKKQSLTSQAGENYTDWEVVPEKEMHLKKGTKKLSREEVMDRADKMLYQKFTYKGFDSNCESFARAIVEGEAYSSQAMKNSPLTNAVSGIVTNSLLKVRFQSEKFPGPADETVRFKVGNYGFVGQSNYAKEKNRWDAKQISDFLEMDRVRASRRAAGEYVVNPNGTKSRTPRPQLSPSRSDAQMEPDRTPEKPFALCLRQKPGPAPVGNDALKLIDAIGMMPTDDYSLLVDAIASSANSPALQEQIKVDMTKNYLMVLLSTIKDDSKDDFSLKKNDSAATPRQRFLLKRQDKEFSSSQHPRDAGGRFARKSGHKIAIAAAVGLGGAAVVGGALTLGGAALLYKAHQPGEEYKATIAREVSRARSSVVASAKGADQLTEEFLASASMPAAARKTLENLHGGARLQASKMIASSGNGFVKVGYDRKSKIVEMEGKNGSRLFLSRVGNQVISFNANVSPIPFGEVVADGAPTYNIGFQVNGDYSSDKASSATSKEIIKKVRQCWNKGIEAMPDNALLETSAYERDGKGARRSSIYKRIGFQYLPGREEGVMYAQKKDGVLQKLDQAQLDTFAEAMSAFDSDTPRKRFLLNRQDKEFSSSLHPRDENGRFASKSGTKLLRPADPTQLSPGSGSVTTGEAGKIVSAGRSYTDSLLDDPEIAAASDRMELAKAKMHKVNAKTETFDGKVIPPEQLVKSLQASSDCADAYNAYKPMMVKKMSALREELKGDSGVSRRQAEKIVGKKSLTTVPPGFTGRAQLREDLTDYVQLTGNDVPTLKTAVVGLKTKGRSYADPSGSKSIFISGDQFNRSTIFHETTHHLEANNPKLVKASEEWATKRSDGKGEQELRTFVGPIYDPGEKAFRDAYVHPYAGKVYRGADNTAEATEVLSMGMQYFDSPERMAQLYILDPDHFNYTLGAIRPNGLTRKDSLTVRDALIEYLHGRYDFDPGLHARDERGRFSTNNGDRGMGVWFEGRRTGTLVRARNKAEAVEKAAKAKKRGGEVVNVRNLTKEEEAIAQKGRWVRTGPNGEKPGELDIPGLGPKPKKLREKTDD